MMSEFGKDPNADMMDGTRGVPCSRFPLGHVDALWWIWSDRWLNRCKRIVGIM